MRTTCMFMGWISFIVFMISAMLITIGTSEHNKNLMYINTQCIYYTADIITYSRTEYNVVIWGFRTSNQIHSYSWMAFPMISSFNEAKIAYDYIYDSIKIGNATFPCIYDPVHDIIITRVYNGEPFIILGITIFLIYFICSIIFIGTNYGFSYIKCMIPNLFKQDNITIELYYKGDTPSP
jgi:hypothetical protein